MAVTLRFQSSGKVPGDAGPITMRGPSLTIGRGNENDVVLPDPDRMVSKTHCVVEDHNGNVVVVDLSTNGTFLNYSKLPLGKTPTPLNSGDVLSLGGYEIVVEINASASRADLLDPLDAGPVSHGNARRAPDPMDLLDAPGPGGDFLDDLLGAGSAPKGPGRYKAEDPFDDILPPMGDDDPFGRPGEAAPLGKTMSAHNASTTDSFRPRQASRPTIPDDWDDLLDIKAPQRPAPGAAARRADDPDFGAPAAPAAPGDNFDFGSPAKAPAPLPDDDDFGLGAPAAPAPAPDFGLDEPRRAPAPAPEGAPPAAGWGGPDEATVTPPRPVAASPATAVPAAPAVPPGGAAAALAFLEALGAGQVQVAEADLEPTMRRLGGVLRTMITGIREILMTRTSIKSEFRIEQTMISAGGNNPLKFSVTPEMAIEAMTRPSAKGFLGAELSAEQALKDIKAHEVAMVTGMEAALKGVLAKLDPARLEVKIEKKGGLGSLLKGRKARYWEIYEEMYAEISDQAENQFHELFSKEFAAAYKEQLDKLK